MLGEVVEGRTSASGREQDGKTGTGFQASEPLGLCCGTDRGTHSRSKPHVDCTTGKAN